MSKASDQARSIMKTVGELQGLGVPLHVLEPIRKYADSLTSCRHCGEQIEPCGTGWTHSSGSTRCKIELYAEPSGAKEPD